MKTEEKDLLSLLIKENYIQEEDVVKIKEIAQKNNLTIINALILEGFLTEELIGQAIAESYNLPFADFNAKKPTHEQILQIPEEIAKKYQAIIFKETEANVTIATGRPDLQNELKKELKKILSKKIDIAYAREEEIQELFAQYRQTLETRFSKIIQSQQKVAPDLINEILKDAIINKASDIHMEPQKENVIIRFRIDGVLQIAGTIEKKYYENILNRVKVQSQLHIDEHACAQDGAIRAQIENDVIDIRVSILPTISGEKITMRILKTYIRGLALTDLGLSTKDQKILSHASKKPFGMILVTGPTGSGKTTTLYSVLRLLNKPSVNITTLEDPVEYKIEGINQIKVNPETNLTFAAGLRSIMRQDPDIILVGEIRDHETSEIAVNAALTGHLLLSTFHANDATTAIPRLIDMGIEPFLLASTLEVIIAQRLVRKICPSCRKSKTETKESLIKNFSIAKEYFTEKSITLYEGKGCSACNGTGYAGRTAIFEFIEITKPIQDIIIKNPSKKEIWDVARKEGTRTLFEDGLEKVKGGITTMEELLRIISPAENK